MFLGRTKELKIKVNNERDFTRPLAQSVLQHNNISLLGLNVNSLKISNASQKIFKVLSACVCLAMWFSKSLELLLTTNTQHVQYTISTVLKTTCVVCHFP